MSDVLSSLQQLRQLRERQAEEMARLDAALAEKRRVRAEERAALRAGPLGGGRNGSSDSLVRAAEQALSTSRALSEARMIAVAAKEKAIQGEIQDRISRREDEREKELLRRTALRQQDVESRQKRTANVKSWRPKPKAYVNKPGELYGADFSRPPENPEITALQRRRSKLLQDQPQTLEKLETQGRAFIDAIARATGDRRNLTATTQTPDPVDFGKGVVGAMGEVPGEDSTAPRPTKPKVLVPRLALDYSDLFDRRVGKSAGVMVFRIEGLRPVALPSAAHGTLCVGDCYVVLQTSFDSGGAARWNIWQWCGSKATLDKRACSAMHAINLRNFLGATSRIQYESEGEESEALRSIFGFEITYLPVEEAADPGLAPVVRQHAAVRLYSVFGHRGMRIRAWEPSASSLRSANAYVLYRDRAIFVWMGAGASQQHRAKARLLADRINSSEQARRAHPQVLEDGAETEEFWNLLGAKPSDRKNVSGTAQFEELAAGTEILYRVAQVVEPSIEGQRLWPPKDADRGNKSPPELRRTLLDTRGCFVLDCGVEIFLWIGSRSPSSLRAKAMEQLAGVVMNEARPSWLILHRVFEGCEQEVFRLRFADWTPATGIGRQLWPSAAREFKVDVGALYKARATLPNSNVTDLALDDEKLEAMVQQANELLESMMCFVFAKGRFQRVRDPRRNILSDSSAYVLLCTYRTEEEDTQTRALREDCGTNGKMRGSSTQEVAEAKNQAASPEFECVVYFWGGRHAPRVSWPTFMLKALPDIKSATAEQWGAEPKVVRVEPLREPIALLAHWNRRLVIRRATDAALQTPVACVEGDANCARAGTPRTELYHVWTDPHSKASRAVEVAPAKPWRLVSRDCFYVRAISSETAKPVEEYLWVGKGASKEEARRAAQLVKDVFGIEGSGCKRIDDRAEPPQFWALLGGKPGDDAEEGPQPGTEYYYVKPPRFFVCKVAEDGQFRVGEIPAPLWAQPDLRADVAAIVDPGAPEPCYLWVGALVSDVLIRLARRAVEVYLENCDDGRQADWEAAPQQQQQQQHGETARGEGSDKGQRARRERRRARHLRCAEGDVFQIRQGSEPRRFQAYFRGWDPDVRMGPLDDESIGSDFSRKEKERREQRRMDREAARKREEAAKAITV